MSECTSHSIGIFSANLFSIVCMCVCACVIWGGGEQGGEGDTILSYGVKCISYC